MLSEINLKADDQRYKALELASLIVDKPYRNEGLGKALVQNLLKNVLNLNIIRLLLWDVARHISKK